MADVTVIKLNARRLLLTLLLAIGLGYGTVSAEDQQPFTMQNLIALAGAGLSEKEIVDRVNQRGVDFDVTPAEAEDLRKAGMSAGAMKAIQTAGNKHKASAPPALSLDQIKNMKAAGLTDEDIVAQIEKRGVNFPFTEAIKADLSKDGFGAAVIQAVEKKTGKGGDTGTGSAPSTAPKSSPSHPVGDADGLNPDAEEPPPAGKLPTATDPLPMPANHAPSGGETTPKNAPKPDDDDDPLPVAPAHTPDGKPLPTKPIIPAGQPKNPFPKRANPIDELAKTTEPDAGLIYGPRVNADIQKKVAELFVEINTASGLNLATDSSKHVTVIATKANITKFLPGIKALETKLEQRFTGVIKTGTDKRSTVIVLLDTQADYKTWITAEFKALGLDQPPPAAAGQAGGGANQLQMALNARGSFLPFVSVQDLSAFTTDQDRNTSVAYAVGLLYMHGIGEGHMPDCFMTGFGNYCESIMYTNPMTRVYSYEERQMGAPPQMTWVTWVKDVVQKRTCSKSGDLLAFSTVTMKPVNYAEAWSFVAFLAQRPKEFEGVITALRDKNGAGQSIDAYFKLKDEQLNYQWQLWASQQN